jgi:hypothetical protein
MTLPKALAKEMSKEEFLTKSLVI